MKTLKEKKYLLVYLGAIIIFLIDLLSKIIVLKNDNILMNKEIIKDFFYLHYSTNTGGAFSILTNHTWIIIILSFAVLIYINHIITTEKLNKLKIVSFSFLIGGIIGNLFDRVFRKEVIDFLSFIIFGYHFPIFNMADIFICIGTILLIIEIIRSDKNECKSNKL